MRGIRSHNFPTLSKVSEVFADRIRLAPAASSRNYLSQLEMEGRALVRKFSKITVSTADNSKLRDGYNCLLELIQRVFHQSFSEKISCELTHILHRLIFLYEASSDQFCGKNNVSENKDEQANSAQNEPTHRHPHPQYKIFVFECLTEQYQKVLDRQLKVNEQIEGVNSRMQALSQKFEEKQRMLAIRHFSEITKLKLKIKGESQDGLGSEGKQNQPQKQKQQHFIKKHRSSATRNAGKKQESGKQIGQLHN